MNSDKARQLKIKWTSLGVITFMILSIIFIPDPFRMSVFLVALFVNPIAFFIYRTTPTVDGQTRGQLAKKFGKSFLIYAFLGACLSVANSYFNKLSPVPSPSVIPSTSATPIQKN